ncbi:ATP-binding protein [Pseudoalteromonas sp. MMG022]|uniref:ATP-binding protein n=1 Tax=Pseudoalteromonas sp. MMG022 TaxID=2909978 RepID=UPI001F2BD74A|nr:ATP-binding protein [Pseudoalteromonas sp. MMG022]MCF6436103.1 ATP-binding protein [Pseudoalteromonas sp. MMG022]
MRFYRSLTFQLGFGLLCIGLMALISAYLTDISYQLLEQRDTEIEQSSQMAEIAHDLELDVIDLQRNVLIYKQSASLVTMNRSQALIETIESTLLRLEQSPNRTEEGSDMIRRMRTHVNDYRDNLLMVISGREKRQSLYQDELLGLINHAQQAIDKDVDANNRALISSHLLSAHNSVLAYLNTQSAEHISKFDAQISAAKAKLSQLNKPTVADHFQNIHLAFRKLHQTIRGYLYLTNVVLTGSANEILHLSSKLRELEEQEMRARIVAARQTMHSLQQRSELFILLSMLLVAVYAAFLILRVIRPIRTLTALFQRLSNNLHVADIPYLKRSDEIGQLSLAASVFHKKNIQITELFERTKELVVEQKELNKELDIKRQEAEQATVSKSLFLANMSHEIRTPMNGIIGLVELMKKSDLQEEQRECLDKIDYSSGVLMSVINDILDFSKIEAGKLDIEEKEFALDKMLENILASVSLRAAEKNLYLRCLCPTELSHFVGDEVRITQIILNLCNNAIKFTSIGGIDIRLSAHGSATGEVILSIEVEDTGVGMSQQHQREVFERFSQADVSTSRKYGGTGLGLAIVKQLCELMHGSISVRSQPDKGSVFSVLLRLKPAQHQEILKLPESNNLAVTLIYHSHDTRPLNLVSEYFTVNNCKVNYLQLGKSKHISQQQIASKHVVLMLDHELSKTLSLSDMAMLQHYCEKLCVVIDKRDTVLLTRAGIADDVLVMEMPFTYVTFYDYSCKLFGLRNGKKQVHVEPEIELNLRGHILLVEDNAVNQMVAKKLLNNLGLEADIAEDGKQAINKLSNTPYAYDLVLMDIQMPVMDGFTATECIRKELKLNIPICGLSANAMSEDFDKAIAHGMDNFLTKPIEMDKLKAVLLQYLH